jgi:hypothetical protein
MKRKTLEFNLSEISERELIEKLDAANPNDASLFSLLETLFDMWSTSLRFSAAVVEYGEGQFPGFLETFARQSAPLHGIPPEHLAKLLKIMRQKRSPSSSLH